MFHKLQEKGIDIPFSYIMKCDDVKWLELCYVYNEIYETIDKKELKLLEKEVNNAR